MDYASTLLQLLPSARRTAGPARAAQQRRNLPAAPNRSSASARPPSSAPRRTRARSASRASPTSRIPLAAAQILADLHLDPDTIIAAILHDVIEDTPISKEELAGELRRAGRRDRRRRHQARPDPVQVARRSAGGMLPQDGARDGARPARDPREARRPHAQHAHARCDGARAAPRGRARDARHLRADRGTPRPLQHEARARRPRLQGGVSASLQGARSRAEEGARQPEAVPQQDRRDDARGAR